MTIDDTSLKGKSGAALAADAESVQSTTKGVEETTEAGKTRANKQEATATCKLTTTAAASASATTPHARHGSSLSSSLKRRRKSSCVSSSQHFQKVTFQYNKCFQNYYHSRTFLKPNPCYIPNMRTSVNHWQLRDLVKYNYKDNLLYYTRGDSIYSYDLTDKFVEKRAKLNYFPRCFDNQNNMIATGGLLTSSSKLSSLNLDNLTSTIPATGAGAGANNNTLNSATSSTSRRSVAKGLFSFYNQDLSLVHTVKIGEMINNDVSLYQTSNSQFTSYLCNNDAILYCVDINNNSNFKVTNKINCEANTCLNASIKNPRSNLLTAVGDSSSIFIIDTQSANPLIKSVDSGGHEGGFGLSYHSDGYIFSAVFQDGTCQLYDLRNLSQPVKEFTSTRKGHQSGAFRVCKISQYSNGFGSGDLLMIAEHVGRVHLIDLKTFERQVIVVPAALDQFANYQQAKHYEDEEEKKPLIKHHEDVLQEIKSPVSIYPDELMSTFTSPIVYDYDYLTKVNTKLFKEFNYIPPQSPLLHHACLADSTPKLGQQPPQPQWIGNGVYDYNLNNETITSVSPNTSRRNSQPHPPHHQSVSYDVDIDSQLNEIYRNYSISSSSSSPSSSPSSSSSSSNDARHSISLFNGYRPSDQHQVRHSNSLSSQSSTSSLFYNTGYCDDSYQQSSNHVHGEMELSGVEFINNEAGDLKIVIACQDAGILIWDVNSALRRSVGGTFEFV
ncbi:uncharacterized protein LODBEIA_P61160 [Lodderomyces beijingensis]|uniref:DUF2415 domain-containing protein n=1 Tax=Lodderomyces beijingensis TaxID=1775926 RepID=A0ABP0ZUT9_9ASCO